MTRTGRLKAVSGLDIDGCHRWLFKREGVEWLRPENRLTAPEAAKLMAIGRSPCRNVKSGGDNLDLTEH